MSLFFHQLFQLWALGRLDPRGFLGVTGLASPIPAFRLSSLVCRGGPSPPRRGEMPSGDRASGEGALGAALVGAQSLPRLPSHPLWHPRPLTPIPPTPCGACRGCLLSQDGNKTCLQTALTLSSSGPAGGGHCLGYAMANRLMKAPGPATPHSPHPPFPPPPALKIPAPAALAPNPRPSGHTLCRAPELAPAFSQGSAIPWTLGPTPDE